MGLVDGYLKRYQDHWFERAEARAWEHPEWAAIQARRHDPSRPETIIALSEDSGLGEVEWERQEAIFRHLNGECPATLWRELFRKYGLAAQRRRVWRFAQRGVRGWADEDTGNLNSYLARVIADSVEYLRDHGHGTPAELSDDEWHDVLTQIVAGFQVAADSNLAGPDDETAASASDDGFALLRKWFAHLWD